MGAPYIGIGISAHSYVHGRRQWNVSQVEAYLSLVEEGRIPCASTEHLKGWEKRQEELWLQLRTCDGIELDTQNRHPNGEKRVTSIPNPANAT